MNPRFILGFDPGLSGALALFDSLEVIGPIIKDMPTKDGNVDPQALAALVLTLCDTAGHSAWGSYAPTIQAVIEKVSSRPRQAGAFNFGLGAGIIQGVLASHGIPFTLVSASQWKPAMGLQRDAINDETKAENKSRARAVASALFPRSASSFKRVKDDGRAEALLLAVFYWHKTKGTPAK